MREPLISEVMDGVTLKKISFMALFASVMIAGCGGGLFGGPVAISGAVIDGYVEGAQVCLDTNGNGMCDTSEPSATTDRVGRYSLSYLGKTAGLHLITVVPPTAKDQDDGGLTLAQAGKAPFAMMAPAPDQSAKNIHVTPLTTLVSYEMKRSGLTDAGQAEQAVKAQLGLSIGLVGNDYKAMVNATNAQTAALASTMAKALGEAQSALLGNTAFTTVFDSGSPATLQAAAQQAAAQVMSRHIAPQIIDHATGGLVTTVNVSNVLQSTNSVASGLATQLAFDVKLPLSQSATIDAFLQGVVMFAYDTSGDYINASGTRVNGNWSGYSNALSVDSFKVNSTQMTLDSQRKVLVSGQWLTRYDDGPDYFLTNSGWTQSYTAPTGATEGDCTVSTQAPNGPIQRICLTRHDFSGRSLTSLISDPCTDSGGAAIAGCTPNLIFPANSYAYSATLSYDRETFRLWVSSSWAGYGSGLNPVQNTLEGYVNFLLTSGVRQAFGGGTCNVGFRVASYDATTKTGVFQFASLAGQGSCSASYSYLSTMVPTQFSESMPFRIWTPFSGAVPVLTFQMPLVFKRNNPYDSQINGIFSVHDGKIYMGEYWPVGQSLSLGVNPSVSAPHIGSRPLFETYMSAIHAPTFPY